MFSNCFYSLLSLEGGPGVSVAAQPFTGKDQVDTGAVLEHEKFNSVLGLFFYISEKKINSTL